MGKEKNKDNKEEPDKTDILLNEYLNIDHAQELYQKNQNDHNVYEIVSGVEGTPVENLLLSGPVTLGLKIFEEKLKLSKEMEDNLGYGDLIKKYDSQKILDLLNNLPLLKKDLKNYEDLAKKHQEYIHTIKLIESKDAKSPEKRSYVANYMKNKTNKKSDYYAAFESKDIDALLGGIALETQRELAEKIESYKKKK